MNFNEIKELIQLLDKSELSSFQYQKDGLKLKIEKKEVAEATVQNTVKTSTVATVVQSPEIEKTLESSAKNLTAEVKSEPIQTGNSDQGSWVKSPLVGVYYSAPNPSSPSFIEIGKKVKKGDVLCIIEAMKVMNEIVAEEDGVVLEIKAVNEHLVEYGEQLVRIG